MTHRVSIYPHNDLLNLAHYHLGNINAKLESGTDDALSLDCMSCLIALAFGSEALVNFVGNAKVENWRERQPYRCKLEQVCVAVGLTFDENDEPYTTIGRLKNLRDRMAHGQPEVFCTTVSTREELREAMQCPWDECLAPHYVNHAFDMVKRFRDTLFGAGDITLGQSLTSAVGQF